MLKLMSHDMPNTFPPRDCPAFGCQPAFKSNTSMLVDSSFMHVFLCYFCTFLSFFFLFSLVTEKDEKTCFHTETNDFDQQMGAPQAFRWSKYTTTLISETAVQFIKKNILN